jgi:hypothetical protein
VRSSFPSPLSLLTKHRYDRYGDLLSHTCVRAPGLNRLEIFGARLRVGGGLAEWNRMAKASTDVLRRRYEMICCRRFFETVRQLLGTKRRVKSFMERFFVRQQEVEQEQVRKRAFPPLLKSPVPLENRPSSTSWHLPPCCCATGVSA